jgi:hypothetical protein
MSQLVEMGVKILHRAAGNALPTRRASLVDGQEQAVLRKIAALPRCRGAAGTMIRPERDYFAEDANRMSYQAVADQSWPIGSGAVEPARRQRQCRRKRSGQFWTRSGLRHLDALEEARDNGHWKELWLTA